MWVPKVTESRRRSQYLFLQADSVSFALAEGTDSTLFLTFPRHLGFPELQNLVGKTTPIDEHP